MKHESNESGDDCLSLLHSGEDEELVGKSTQNTPIGTFFETQLKEGAECGAANDECSVKSSKSSAGPGGIRSFFSRKAGKKGENSSGHHDVESSPRSVKSSSSASSQTGKGSFFSFVSSGHEGHDLLGSDGEESCGSFDSFEQDDAAAPENEAATSRSNASSRPSEITLGGLDDGEGKVTDRDSARLSHSQHGRSTDAPAERPSRRSSEKAAPCKRRKSRDRSMTASAKDTENEIASRTNNAPRKETEQPSEIITLADLIGSDGEEEEEDTTDRDSARLSLSQHSVRSSRDSHRLSLSQHSTRSSRSTDGTAERPRRRVSQSEKTDPLRKSRHKSFGPPLTIDTNRMEEPAETDTPKSQPARADPGMRRKTRVRSTPISKNDLPQLKRSDQVKPSTPISTKDLPQLKRSDQEKPNPSPPSAVDTNNLPEADASKSPPVRADPSMRRKARVRSTPISQNDLPQLKRSDKPSTPISTKPQLKRSDQVKPSPVPPLPIDTNIKLQEQSGQAIEADASKSPPARADPGMRRKARVRSTPISANDLPQLKRSDAPQLKRSDPPLPIDASNLQEQGEQAAEAGASKSSQAERADPGMRRKSRQRSTPVTASELPKLRQSASFGSDEEKPTSSPPLKIDTNNLEEQSGKVAEADASESQGERPDQSVRRKSRNRSMTSNTNIELPRVKRSSSFCSAERKKPVSPLTNDTDNLEDQTAEAETSQNPNGRARKKLLKTASSLSTDDDKKASSRSSHKRHEDQSSQETSPKQKKLEDHVDPLTEAPKTPVTQKRTLGNLADVPMTPSTRANKLADYGVTPKATKTPLHLKKKVADFFTPKMPKTPSIQTKNLELKKNLEECAAPPIVAPVKEVLDITVVEEQESSNAFVQLSFLVNPVQ